MITNIWLKDCPHIIAVYNQAHDKEKIINSGRPSKNYESEYSQKIYYGRVNRLTFRLCHEYCETCKELGNSNDKQKCVTCLPQYRYDYVLIREKSVQVLTHF